MVITEGDSDERIDILINSDLLLSGLWGLDSQRTMLRELSARKSPCNCRGEGDNGRTFQREGNMSPNILSGNYALGGAIIIYCKALCKHKSDD